MRIANSQISTNFPLNSFADQMYQDLMKRIFAIQTSIVNWI